MTHALIATHIHSYLSLTLLFPFVIFIAQAHPMTHTTPNGPFTTPIVTHHSHDVTCSITKHDSSRTSPFSIKEPSSLVMYSLDLSTQDSPSAKPKPLLATPVLGYHILLYCPLQVLVSS